MAPGLSEAAPHPPAGSDPSGESRLTFFRQGTWLILATGLGGVFMLGTQMVASKAMTEEEWGTFYTLLRVYLLFGIPSIGLQTVFAHQTAAAVTPSQQALLAATVRAVLRGTFGFWILLAVVTLAAQPTWLRLLGVGNPVALWVTLLLGLASLWVPVFKGVVQGQQHFPGLGWSIILDGVGRFLAVTCIVVVLGGQAAGGITGALLGQIASLAVVVWVARSLLRQPGAGFTWGRWLAHVVPLTLGTGVFTVMATADVVIVRAVFTGEQSTFYNQGAMIGLALLTVATPLVQVMFPKVARSAALTRPSQAVALALGATAAAGAGAALLCSLFPELPLRIIFVGKPEAWKAAPLVPWFAWALLPLVLAMVLVNNLLARGKFRIVPFLLVVTGLYLGALILGRDWLRSLEFLNAFRAILATLAGSNVLLLVLAVYFTKREHVPVAVEAPSV